MCDALALCRPFSDPEVVEWAFGRSHSVPPFEDATQQNSAAAVRRSVMMSHVANRNYESLASFPEWTWGVGVTHERPRFADAYDSELACARRKQTIETLMRQDDVASLMRFPEWQQVMSALNMPDFPDMSRTLKCLPRPSKMPRNVKARRRMRRWLAYWNRKFDGSFRYLLHLLHQQVDQARSWEKASWPLSRREQRYHQYFYRQSIKVKRKKNTPPEFTWREPHPQLSAWMNGWYHGPQPKTPDFAVVTVVNGRPQRFNTTFFTERLVQAKRRQAFFNACLECDPEIVIWPEFHRELKKLHLTSLYDRGTISAEVACVFIANQNAGYGRWQMRANRLRRQGVDPLTRHGYVRAEHQFYQALMYARKKAEKRYFIAKAHKAMEMG